LNEIFHHHAQLPQFKLAQLCIASVADQQAVEVEHIVQDSCSMTHAGLVAAG